MRTRLTACSHVPTQTQTPKFGLISFNIVSMVDGQIRSGTYLARILVLSIGTMLKLYRSDFKINSVSLRVNKPLMLENGFQTNPKVSILASSLVLTPGVNRAPRRKIEIHRGGYTAVEDPGFLRRWRQHQRWGCQTIIWPNFLRKLHENERNCTRERGGEGGGRQVLALPLDPPMYCFI